MKYFFLFVFFSSCCKNSLDLYKDKNPKMDFKKFYNAKVEAKGIYFTRAGIAKSRFIIKSEPKIKDEKLNKVIYKQSIDYIDSNEHKDMETYALFDENNLNKFIYKDELMTQEAEYEQAGNVAKIKYDLKVERNGKTWIVSCEDWSYMIDEKNIINTIEISKFGVNVGKIVMSISKQ